MEKCRASGIQSLGTESHACSLGKMHQALYHTSLHYVHALLSSLSISLSHTYTHLLTFIVFTNLKDIFWIYLYNLYFQYVNIYILFKSSCPHGEHGNGQTSNIYMGSDNEQGKL